MTKPTGAYAWLNAEPAPRMLLEALKIYGTLETPGTADNPVILGWADEVAAVFPTPYTRWAADFYNDDSIAWCGLAMAVIAVRANPEKRPDRNPPDRYLSAASWQAFGVHAARAELGDVLVFQRPGGHHVALYVGEDVGNYHVLGANQSDTVNITRIDKARCIAARRPPYVLKPLNVRQVIIGASGPVSTNEA